MEQGSLMDRRLGSELLIPAASLSIFNTLSIVLLIPLYDRGLVPLLKRMGIRISNLARIGAPAWPECSACGFVRHSDPQGVATGCVLVLVCGVQGEQLQALQCLVSLS